MSSTNLEQGRRRQLWVVGLVAIVLVNLLSLTTVFDGQDLWRDTENHDTRTLLRETRKQDSLMRWFVHDWPLGNGFYRPLPTLLFQADDAIYRNNLGMYRLTNWFIGLACSLLLAWWVFELFQSVWGGLCCAIVFSMWQSGLAHSLPFTDTAFMAAGFAVLLPLSAAVAGKRGGILLAVTVSIAGGVLGRVLLQSDPATGLLCVWICAALIGYALKKVGALWPAISAAGLMLFLWRELSCWLEKMDIVQASFSFRNIGWPPGRTATLMTLFVLLCLASYCRFERTRRNSWAIWALVGLVLAFLSYEQAVVAPAALLGCAIALRLQGVNVRWKFHLAPWLILASYLLLHRTYLHDTRYRKQAYRGSQGAYRDLLAWALPGSFELRYFSSFFGNGIGWLFVLVPTLWEYMCLVASNAIAYIEAKKEWLACGFGLVGSVCTFLPMAFQHPLVHYYYLPMTFRSIFVTWLALITWRKLVILASRPSPRAQRQLDLAPR